MVRSRLYSCLLFLSFGILTLSAQDSLLYRSITVRDTVCSVETALNIIERQTGLSFSYNSGLINRKKVITLGAKNEKLIDLLKRILNNPTLDFSIIGRHLVIYQPLKTPAANPESLIDSVFYFEIRGRVLDKDDKQPLPYTSIYIQGKSMGTVSNEEGRFLLKLSSVYIKDTVNISCIGYKHIITPVASLINTDKDYQLKADLVSIQEVIIRKLSPLLLLESALKKIDNNFSVEPAVLTSFYRETVKKGSRYMMVSEAILENYKTGYHALAAVDQVKILKGRKSENITGSDSVVLKLKAGLNTMLLLDVVKNMPDFLTGESPEDYDYKLADIVIDNGQDNYSIEFAPRPSSLTAIYSGRIILGIKDLAYKWVEFSIDPEHLDMATDLFVIRKPAYMKVKVLKAHYKVAFRKTGSQYYLHLIECETEFRIRNKNQLSGSVYNTTLEMAVTDIDTVNAARFPFRETARLNEFFTEQVGSYDGSFWGEYNYITPDESLEDALVKISKAAAARKEEGKE
jgi:hypothetical protein